MSGENIQMAPGGQSMPISMSFRDSLVVAVVGGLVSSGIRDHDFIATESFAIANRVIKEGEQYRKSRYARKDERVIVPEEPKE